MLSPYPRTILCVFRLFKNLAFPRGIKIKSKSFTRFDLSARVSSDFSSSSSQHSQESNSTDGVVVKTTTQANTTPKPAYLGVDKLREIKKISNNLTFFQNFL